MNEAIVADVVLLAVLRALKESEGMLRSKILTNTAKVSIRASEMKAAHTVHVSVDVDPRTW